MKNSIIELETQRCHCLLEKGEYHRAMDIASDLLDAGERTLGLELLRQIDDQRVTDAELHSELEHEMWSNYRADNFQAI